MPFIYFLIAHPEIAFHKNIILELGEILVII